MSITINIFIKINQIFTFFLFKEFYLELCMNIRKVLRNDQIVIITLRLPYLWCLTSINSLLKLPLKLEGATEGEDDNKITIR